MAPCAGAVGTAPPTRDARLHALARKLESILDELDELGAQRVAIDVCMALERIKVQLADEGDAPAPFAENGSAHAEI
ncbi:hypothetical protein [Novosphingobium sp. Gsoil 351]|uniref:hypothetical protein n=1 Tax=Novosphingobium sp. Gsoil 351 TaxID=2675225 RepID=UPI0012B48016|nr:hypothetical protein [Novosphingobium sp. Gsoil 351]QGN54094.1 hypothetical protein GKE62_05590 [Novosphingobium sp. Gsoil 351]